MRNKIKNVIKKAAKGGFILSTWSIVIIFIYLDLIKRTLRKGEK